MNRLPQNFGLDKYGLNVRLVNEDDADFIVKLRTNPRLSKFIHATDNDIEKQKQWIRNYKLREKDGIEYYFVYLYNGERIGVNRIYSIHDMYATGGSWVCKPDINVEQSISTMLIERDILFEILNLNEDKFDVRKGNTHVIKMHKMLGACINSEDDLNYYFRLDKDTYLKNRSKLIRLLNLQ